jgi:hypothetical protein
LFSGVSFGSASQPAKNGGSGLFGGTSQPAQNAGSGLFGGGSQTAQNAGSSLFGGGSQLALATKNGSANITGKSPQSKGTDTELLFLENDRGNSGKEQFQYLSSYVPLNKSFEVSACASISEVRARYTNKNPGD